MSKFPNFCFVRGYKNTVVQDLAKGTFKVIENSKFDLKENFPIKAPKSDKIQLKWESPSKIENAIISVSEKNGLLDLSKLSKILDILQELLCKHVVLNITCDPTMEGFKSILATLDKFNIHSATILLGYHEEYFSNNFADLIIDSGCVFSCIIFNSPFDKNFSNLIHFTSKKQIFNYKKSFSQFASNIPLFLEAQNYNTYFNRKLFIGAAGEIKNAPECEEVFGNINKLNLKEDLEHIIEQNTFQQFWKINKDQCFVCKECEFRYMCVDNRKPYQSSDNIWFYKTECNYNPYIGKWKGEEGFQSLGELGIKLYFNEK